MKVAEKLAVVCFLIRVLVGGSVSLNCSSDANPGVKYSWFTENGDQIGTEHTFTITNTDPTHSGFYYCRAQNRYRAQTSSVQLDVQYHKQSTMLYLILTAVLLLSFAVIGVLLHKLKQLSSKMKAVKVEGDTYASLQLSAQSSEYETLQPNRERMVEKNKI